MQQTDEVNEAGHHQLDALRDGLLTFDGATCFELGSWHGGFERVTDPQVEFRSPCIDWVRDLREPDGYREVAVRFVDGQVATFRLRDVETVKANDRSLLVRLREGRAVHITHE